MNKMTIDMPMVAQCNATDCAYNLEKKCHARAITVGDGVHPGCDTYFMSSGHVHEKKRMAGIGACKVSQCRNNTDLECMADSINVGRSGNDITCMTFMAR
jgi:hypothetical protein